MQNLVFATRAIKDGDYDIAIKYLKKEYANKDAYYLMSLIYRLHDQYEEENKLINFALDDFPTWEYIKERKKWFDKKIPLKLENRQSIHMPRDYKNVPLNKTIKNLCFVTGGDAKFFDLMVECISSIKLTRLYKDVPFYVLDFGLEKDQIKYLKDVLKIKKVKDPKWDIKIKEVCEYKDEKIKKKKITKHYKAMISRPYLNKHFPGHTYYMWLDADAWVQDERALDKYLCICEKEKMGLSRHITFDRYNDDNIYFNQPVLTKKQKEFLNEKDAIIVSAFCLHHDIFKKWQEIFEKTVKEQGFWWNSEEQTLGYLAHYDNIKEFIPHQDHHALVREGLPIVNNDDNILIGPKTGQIIGTIHLSSGKWFYYFKSQKRNAPINNQEDWKKHMQFFNWGVQRQVVFKNNILPCELNIPDSKEISCRFKVLPWSFKKEMKEKLEKEANIIANNSRRKKCQN